MVDFICLSENAVTIKTILEYFKDKNPKWKDVTSVVIDKDFVEWQVLEECFPTAQVLLCQFHAITYWKKVMKRKVFELKMAQREELIELLTKMLYWCVTVSKFLFCLFTHLLWLLAAAHKTRMYLHMMQ